MMSKAVAHVHSDWSYDGKWSLSQIVHFFRKLGYDLVLTAEHDRTFDTERWEAYKKACSKASTARTLMLPGIEYSDETNTIHVLVWGVSTFLGNNQTTAYLLQRIKELNGFCVLAHPSRRNAWLQLDTACLSLLHGIEQWNRKFDGIAPSREAIQLSLKNDKLLPFVGLDFHRTNQYFPLSMILNIDGSLTQENVINALYSGQCHPRALGLDAAHFNKGILAHTARVAERSRRYLAQSIKQQHRDKK